MTQQPQQDPLVPPVIAQMPEKKKKRIFMWFFLAVQALFLIWIFAGIGGSEATDCGSLDQETCQAATDVGTGIGIILIIGFWIVVDFLLAVGYLVYRVAKRP